MITNFNAVITMMSRVTRSAPATYKVSVYPSGQQGPVASIDYEGYAAFAWAAKRMGIEGDALRGLMKQVESGRSISHMNFALTAPDAAYFGWSHI